jgi:hypothetical protein
MKMSRNFRAIAILDDFPHRHLKKASGELQLADYPSTPKTSAFTKPVFFTSKK